MLHCNKAISFLLKIACACQAFYIGGENGEMGGREEAKEGEVVVEVHWGGVGVVA